MTHVLAVWVGVALGAGVTYSAHRRWAEEHHYRQVRVEVVDRDAAHQEAAVERNRAADLRRRLAAAEHRARAQVGLIVAGRAPIPLRPGPHRPRHRRNVVPAYGANR